MYCTFVTYVLIWNVILFSDNFNHSFKVIGILEKFFGYGSHFTLVMHSDFTIFKYLHLLLFYLSNLNLSKFILFSYNNFFFIIIFLFDLNYLYCINVL